MCKPQKCLAYRGLFLFVKVFITKSKVQCNCCKVWSDEQNTHWAIPVGWIKTSVVVKIEDATNNGDSNTGQQEEYYTRQNRKYSFITCRGAREFFASVYRSIETYLFKTHDEEDS